MNNKEMYILIIVIVAILSFAVILMWFVADAQFKEGQRMIKLCTPDPTTFECQLYLAKQEQQSINSAAMTGGMVGGMVSGLATRVGK